MKGPVNIGLVGAGTVGGGVVKLIHSQAAQLENRLGFPVRLKRIADKATERFATLPIEGVICSASADDIINDDDIHVVIELVGGTGFARELILKALNRGKHVITANKALIAEHGPAIFEAAEKNNVSVHFEAAVGGGMPVIKTIREALVANRITSVKTIINGTSNYILTQMSDKGLHFETSLKKAQEKGYAEADPTLDIGGGDSGHKVSIMASLIKGGYVPYNKISIEGITTVSKEDIEFARELGYCIKLLGIIRTSDKNDIVDVRVHPAMLHRNHVLASVSDVFNAVLLEGDAVGSILLYGRGAGEMPTASAVMSDVVDVALDINGNSPKRISMGYYTSGNEVAIQPIEEIISRYYLCFWVADKAKVLASIASVLGDHAISIASVMQKESGGENCVPVIILTHDAQERNLRAALGRIEKMDFVKRPTHVIRVAGQE